MMLRTRWPSGCPSLRVGQRHAVGRRYRSTRSPALFTIPQLASPSDFTAWTEDAQSRAVTLRAIVLSENSPLAPPKSLDLISDTLCSVADVAECARLIAPKSSGWGAHAHAARMRIQATMEAFNSDHAIYSVLKHWFDANASRLAAANSKRDVATLQTTRLLLHDFEKAGLHTTANAEAAKAYQEQMARIAAAEDLFLTLSSAAHPSPVAETTAALESLVRERALLAQSMGEPSFAHFTLKQSTLGTPEAVERFLQSTVREASHQLTLADRQPAQRTPVMLRLDDVLEDLDGVCQTLFGVRLHRATLLHGETWENESIIKLEVQTVHTNVTLGTVYLDLAPREGKLPHPGHFNLRSGRRVDNDPFPLLEGIVTVKDDAGCRFQTPIVLLSMVIPPHTTSWFGAVPRPGPPAALTVAQTETLCHNVIIKTQDARLAIFGVTEYQNVSGTRTATDFVEIPSILMEYVMRSAGALQKSIHRATKGTVKETRAFLIDQLPHHAPATRYAEVLRQCQLSLFDQRVHSSLALQEPVSPGWSSNAFHHLVDTVLTPHHLSILPNFHLRFSHLAHYGATYYSYVFCRQVAAKLYDEAFGNTQQLTPEGGHRLRETILSWGGARPGQASLFAFFGDNASLQDLLPRP